MNRYIKLIARYFRARQFGVAFRGTQHTVLPSVMKFGGRMRQIRVPNHQFMISDWMDIVLDDDYGFRKIHPEPRMIVDIGANIGNVCNFARDCFPNAIIQAYEPSPENVELARFNAEHPLTTIYAEGVSNTDGRGDIIDHGLSNIVQTRTSDDGDVALVSFATVLERAGGHIDLLKVDCEGAEWSFMTDPALFAHVDRIRMEYHLVGGHTIDDVRALAPALGFRLTKLSENDGYGIAWMDKI